MPYLTEITGEPKANLRYLVLAKIKNTDIKQYNFAFFGESMYDPDKGRFWFTDTGTELYDVERIYNDLTDI